MKIFYKYIFEKELLKIDKNELLNSFEQNFKRSGCYHKINRKEDGIDLINDLQDLNYLYKMVGSWNLWNGTGEINIRITQNLSDESYLIEFSVSILRRLVIYALEFIIFFIILITNYSTGLFYFFLLLNIAAITLYFIMKVRFKRFFNKTIEIGDFYKNQVSKSYDWKIILAKKADSELREIIDGKSFLPDIVIELAKNEIENRKANK